MKYMNKKIVSVCLALFLVGAVLIAPLAGADDSNFPNVSTSSTFIYSLDLDGNCELFTIVTIENIDHNYTWTQDTSFNFPISIISFSDEQPTLTNVTIQNIDTKYNIVNYRVTRARDQYKQDYYVAVFPPFARAFNKNDIATITTKNRINNSSRKIGDFYRFIISDIAIGHSKNFVIKAILPNNPYYWVELLHTTEKFDYHISIGGGKSLEWYYKKGDSYTKFVMIDYKIHPDPLKQELDNATKQSRDISEQSLHISHIALLISIVLGLFSIRGDLNKIKPYLNKMVKTLQKYIHSAIYKRKNAKK